MVLQRDETIEKKLWLDNRSGKLKCAFKNGKLEAKFSSYPDDRDKEMELHKPKSVKHSRRILSDDSSDEGTNETRDLEKKSTFHTSIPKES